VTGCSGDPTAGGQGVQGGARGRFNGDGGEGVEE
jgi:hypothetical protein